MTGHAFISSIGPGRDVDTPVAQKQIAHWLHLIRSEFLEMPGLHLTKKQVQRLWNLDAGICDALLAALIDVRFLRQTHGGGYVRADGGGH